MNYKCFTSNLNNSDYDNFTNKFTEVYDEYIPLKKVKINRKTIYQSPWITIFLLKSINNKIIKYTNNTFCVQVRIAKLSLKHTEKSSIIDFEIVSEIIIIITFKKF